MIIQIIRKYYTEAMYRATRRQSSWNLVLFICGFCMTLFFWYGLFKLTWLFHIAIYPEHNLHSFWKDDINFRIFILSFLMVISLFPVAVILAFMMSNLLFWFISPIRHIFEAEAQQCPDTDFQSSMISLLKTFLCVFPICLITALISAYFLNSLQ